MRVYGIYLGLEVGIWEPLWALSIYHTPTWTLWVSDARFPLFTKGVASCADWIDNGEDHLKGVSLLADTKNEGEPSGKDMGKGMETGAV